MQKLNVTLTLKGHSMMIMKEEAAAGIQRYYSGREEEVRKRESGTESSLLVMDAMFLATYPHLSSAHHDPREPKKGKVMVKGHKKCIILWILTF